MSNVGPEGRSFERITKADLRRLLRIAEEDLSAFFDAHNDWAKLYRGRILAVALCQGAALHRVEGKVGVHDFDVYTFFSRHLGRPWGCARRKKHADFGDPKFGTSPDKPHFRGRRVDLLTRDLEAPLRSDPADAIRAWLSRAAKGSTAWHLAQKAVILLSPAERLGEVVWSPGLTK